MKKLFLFFLLGLNASGVFAQNAPFAHPYINESKYWFYRNRLINEFMVLGGDGDVKPTDNGTCNIASFVLEDKSKLDFGDGTVRIGHYLAVLATEYALLARNPAMNTEALLQNKKELVYTLKALDRMDLNGEVHDGGTASLNGYLCRTDILSNDFAPTGTTYNVHNRLNAFYKNYLPSNQNNVTIGDAFNGSSGLHMMTKDQVNHLLIGFRSIVQFVPSGVSYSDGYYSVTDIKAYAQTITTRIMDYIYDNGGWIIKDPNTGNKITESGGDAATLSYGFATAAASITGKAYSVTLFDKLWFKNIGRLFSIYDNVNFKYLSLATVGDSWGGCNNICKKKTCIISVFGYCLLSGWVADLSAPATCCSNGSLSTGKTLDKHSYPAHYEFLPLMYNLFYNKSGFEHNSDYYRNFYTSKIDAAPCRGPWSYIKFSCLSYGDASDVNNWENVSTESHAKGGWADYSLFNGAARGDNWYWYCGDTDADGSCDPTVNGSVEDLPLAFGSEYSRWPSADYNGLDYMLLYNLYQLFAINEYGTNAYNAYTPNYGNNLYLHNYSASNNSVENFTARSFVQAGTTFNGEIHASNNFSCPTGHTVNFKAGSSVALGPGFSAAPGSKFSAVTYMPKRADGTPDNLAWEMDLCSNIDQGFRVASNNTKRVVNNDPLPQAQNIEQIMLEQNYPNPFSGSSKFHYTLKSSGSVRITMSDLMNKTVSELVNENYRDAGTYEVILDGSKLNAGVYVYTIEAGRKIETKKMVVIK
jgi:hypothetical protein